ncbi:hypothetical protein VOLCADRAFT_90569 [Volvox carteri f. nagariensis]|uniref:Uncharacterized protein n=1 Tax=Volvox carteri f. nagariensis TaxID=3068 RepID=D8TUR6_VOLCA|nr:uncharacterized protein VOLCADRAFT_90569 [Volvox carteri f. nagariensis]EFJ48754.1 hypothetical protein VOLCADRAFT_90569 [Volvox carteri f. nagariensis]|eukprot:XP_002950086.1 hypothetical protein VOLCADRAFT_90569 [Volvox carteri f. nagariensis]
MTRSVDHDRLATPRGTAIQDSENLAGPTMAALAPGGMSPDSCPRTDRPDMSRLRRHSSRLPSVLESTDAPNVSELMHTQKSYRKYGSLLRTGHILITKSI